MLVAPDSRKTVMARLRRLAMRVPRVSDPRQHREQARRAVAGAAGQISKMAKRRVNR
jgi:hypothetical protein